MFESLSGRLSDVFGKLRGRGALSVADIDAAMRDVRVALLEADVALPVVRSFIDRVKESTVGQEVIRSVTPGQMVIKIVHDELVATLGADSTGLDLNAPAPVGIMMVGLQGSGKTTTTAKIAARLQNRDRKKVLMASLDTRRPAAQEQLKVLGEQAGVSTLPIVAGQRPVEIAKRAGDAARFGGYDVILYDTAGRLQIDQGLMDEVAAVQTAVRPHEILLVADAMTGQDAVNVAEGFKARLPLTGIVLTRVDGDSRGGGALSMRAVTGCPIKLIGTGETLEALEDFHPDRIAGRILGMGDVVSLVEKAAEGIQQDEAEALAKKMRKGEFDLNDMAKQLSQMRKMGGISGMLELLPGVAKAKAAMAKQNIDDRAILRQEAIISSMTRKERLQPKVIHASRKKRIAAGSGTSIQDVNKLLKQFMTMQKMMKRVNKMGKKGLMRHGIEGLLPRM
ncbi:MAG: signal recognition particle protein [Alphaproteobacteria bacterium]